MDKIFENIKSSEFLDNITINTGDFGLSKCCEEVIMTLSNFNVRKIASETEQGSDTWKRERQLRITGM